MRKIILSTLLAISLQISTAQINMNEKYEVKWKAVETAFSKGLNASAEKEIEGILKMARSENNTGQIIKALLNYRVSLRDRDEKARVNDILVFEKELKTATFPSRQIIHSILGDLYWTYYTENRWKILNRTRVASDDEVQEPAKSANDIETWTANDFYQQAYTHFNASLSESEKTKSFSLKNIEVILEKGQNTEKLRPTLYDFLLHRAIAYFSMDENELTKPAYAFEIKDAKAFADAAAFSRAAFNTSDTTSQKYNVLKLYQKVLAFHLNDADPSALIDADIARLRYVLDHTSLNNKNELYITALNNIVLSHPENVQAGMAAYYIAESYTQGAQNRGRRINKPMPAAEDKTNYVEARRLLGLIIEKYPGSEASYRAQSLIQQIEVHTLSIRTEKVILPDMPSLAKIDYRNVSTIYCKIIKLTNREYKDYVYNYNDTYKGLTEKSAIKNWSTDLPDPKDLKPHSTEIKIDALPLGVYALLVSESNTFDNKSFTEISFLNVSDFSWIYAANNVQGGSEVYVMHRKTGEPIQNAAVKTWTHNYNYTSRKTEMKAGPAFTTDKNGYFKISRQDPGQNGYALEFTKGDDNLFINENVYVNEHTQKYNDFTRTFLFTDRSMYRPGQTIYFKGIMVLTKGNEMKEHELLKNKKTTVQLRDVNGQTVKELALTTNEYGSYSGTFIAPEGLLTGRFQIVGESGEAGFNVEEYKRPKFEVSYDTLKNSYKLYDEIKVKGFAKAFAGNNIDGAMVKYRIVREARFPCYWCFYKWGRPSSPGMEIANGTTKTKADGSFEISFTAIPDEDIDKQTQPVFDYTVYADVSDLNGETRSGTTSISVSYQSLFLKIEMPEETDFNDFNAVKVYSTNLAGTHVGTQVSLSFKKLKAPAQTYRSRLWDKAELKSIPEVEFRRDFPLDEYDNENDYMTWKEEKTMWTKNITTSENGIEYLQKISNEDGWYVIEAVATDKSGETIREKKYIRLTTHTNPEALPNEHLLLTRIKVKAEPGETAKIAFATPYENIYFLYHNERYKKPVTEWISISKNRFFEYDINEADRGGFNVTGMFVKNSRIYKASQFIEVPWTNKELHIALETFRDKILPGSEQEWKLKVTGSRKEKLSAEVLATMYDASLDAFAPHNLNGLGLFQTNNTITNWNTQTGFGFEEGRLISSRTYKQIPYYEKSYSQLNWWGLGNRYNVFGYAGGKTLRSKNTQYEAVEEDAAMPFAQSALPSPVAANAINGEMNLKAPMMEQTKFTPPVLADSITVNDIQLRSNFAETAFFFPQLQTDEDGNIIFRFTAPDALTRWKLLAFGHTTDLRSGQMTANTTTQKPLMIVPNTPRFFREGDKMVYSAKVSNLSEYDVNGQALLQLFDAVTEKPVDQMFANSQPGIPFSAPKGESASLSWNIEIPAGFTDPVLIKVFAKTNEGKNGMEAFSDGEQNMVPVLLNSMLVTETLPMPVRANSSKDFSFKNLLNANASNTLRHYNLSVEYTGNPAWYAVQALPYLTDYPYECAEQTFNRYYANVLATHMANASPKIKEIFASWKDKDTAALMSNLQKNQELKSALIQETPWVMEAKNEEQQKQNIATLFNLNRMGRELERTVRELEILQTPNGGFTWFKGMPDDRFITQYIITGIGRLLHIGISETGSEGRIKQVIEKAIPYLDARIKEDYEQLLKHKADLKLQHIGYTQIQYLYMRSFFRDKPVVAGSKTAFEYYKAQAAKYWLNTNRYMQGMTALALHRWNDPKTPEAIIKSLRENAIRSEEMGMYWKEVNSSYWWYEAPVETQALLVEAFREIGKNDNEVDELKIWLLKNKQTQNWRTTKATADAIYALLLNGTDWLSSQPAVEITLGEKTIRSGEQKQEAGTGYFKTSIPKEEIKAEMGNIHVKVLQGNGTTWGAVYWQYFENLDKIAAAETPLSIRKQLFIEKNTGNGPVLNAISEKTPLQVGDKVKVRIELRVDRDMEYVHMKDMRAACFEPVNVLSNYKYQGGLGYYEATKDASTNFFFNWLRKGTYVFEYPMFVTNKGDYSNGICTIQCMYAPEFSSHSEGIRVEVK